MLETTEDGVFKIDSWRQQSMRRQRGMGAGSLLGSEKDLASLGAGYFALNLATKRTLTDKGIFRMT